MLPIQARWPPRRTLSRRLRRSLGVERRPALELLREGVLDRLGTLAIGLERFRRLLVVPRRAHGLRQCVLLRFERLDLVGKCVELALLLEGEPRLGRALAPAVVRVRPGVAAFGGAASIGAGRWTSQSL